MLTMGSYKIIVIKENQEMKIKFTFLETFALFTFEVSWAELIWIWRVFITVTSLKKHEKRFFINIPDSPSGMHLHCLHF